MPPRCAVPWPRSASRPGPSSQDGIWITDAMLLRAFERYSRVSTASARHLSSVPGPIESRRRLGKRQMTGIMPESHASAPPWAIELPWQLGEWKWEAPTAPEDRKLGKAKFSVRQTVDRFIGWLESRDEDTPLIHSPSVTDATSPPTPLQQAVFALRQEIISSKQPTEVKRLCSEFQRDLESMIHLRMVTSADLLVAFNLFSPELRKHLHSTPYWDNITASIGCTILKAIVRSRRTTRHDAYGREFWLSFTKQIRQLTPQRATFNLFALCMDSVPRADLNCEDLFDMTTSFITHQANKDLVNPTTLTEFLKAPKRLTPTDAAQWRDHVVEFLRALPKDEWKQRFHGILVLAHHRHTSTDQFLKASIEICGKRRWDLDEAFWLLKGRLWAWKCVDPKNIGLWLRQTANSQGWASLVLLILNAPADIQPMLFKRICRLTDRLGVFDQLAEALAREMPNRSIVLRNLAIASGNHKLALRLWEAVHGGKHASRTHNTWAWDWTAWSPYIEKMIKDPEMDQDLVWKVISLGRTSHNHALPDRVLGGINNKVQLLDMMSKWYLEASHLSDRQILRRIQSCINHHQRINKNVSTALLGNMTQAVLRDMERGFTVPASRLDYLVVLIQKYLGEKEAEAAITQIRGWRWTIKNQSGAEPWLNHEVLRQNIEAGLPRELELAQRKAIDQPRRRQQRRIQEKMRMEPEAVDDVSAHMRYLRKEMA